MAQSGSDELSNLTAAAAAAAAATSAEAAVGFRTGPADLLDMFVSQLMQMGFEREQSFNALQVTFLLLLLLLAKWNLCWVCWIPGAIVSMAYLVDVKAFL